MPSRFSTTSCRGADIRREHFNVVSQQTGRKLTLLHDTCTAPRWPEVKLPSRPARVQESAPSVPGRHASKGCLIGVRCWAANSCRTAAWCSLDVCCCHGAKSRGTVRISSLCQGRGFEKLPSQHARIAKIGWCPKGRKVFMDCTILCIGESEASIWNAQTAIHSLGGKYPASAVSGLAVVTTTARATSGKLGTCSSLQQA